MWEKMFTIITIKIGIRSSSLFINYKKLFSFRELDFSRQG